MVPAYYAKAFLRRLYRTAQKLNISLQQAIEDSEDSVIDATSSGTVVIGSSANGHSASFQLPPGASITPERLVELHTHLQTLYDRAAASFATDSDIHLEMQFQLSPVKEFTTNHSELYNAVSASD